MLTGGNCLHQDITLPVCRLPDVYCSLDELLEAGWTAPVGAQTLLHGGHEVLQVFCEVLMLITKQVNLQCCLVDL